MQFRVQDIIDAHKSDNVDSNVTKFESNGIVQYYISGNRVEFMQLDSETGDLLNIVNGAARHYAAKDSMLAARHISNDLTRDVTNNRKPKRN